MLAKLQNSLLTLVCRDEIREFRPARDQLEAPVRIGLDLGRRRQRDGDAWAGRAHRSERCGARRRLKCLDILLERVEM